MSLVQFMQSHSIKVKTTKILQNMTAVKLYTGFILRTLDAILSIYEIAHVI